MPATQARYPGALSLLNDLDKKVVVVLRDGRTLIGYIRCIDQFANLVIHNTIERIYVGSQYGDIPRGVFLVRGENVGLVGELDIELEKKNMERLQEVTVEEILEAQRRDTEAKERLQELRTKAMKSHGLCPVSDMLMDEMA